MENGTVLNYRERANELFTRWKESSGTVECRAKRKTEVLRIDHKNSVFITDGIVCPEVWFSQTVRPLFLLKEAYGGKTDWDLTKDHLCQTHPASKMWKRISLWTKGLLATTKDTIAPFVQEDPSTENYGNDYLKRIAVVNVKKSGGDKSSDMNTIRAYAEFDKNRLNEQLKLCDPTVIVCGYTSSALDIILEEQIRKSRNQNLAYHIGLNGHDVLVLDYWHPANQYPDIMNYYGLMSIFQLALRCENNAATFL